MSAFPNQKTNKELREERAKLMAQVDAAEKNPAITPEVFGALMDKINVLTSQIEKGECLTSSATNIQSAGIRTLVDQTGNKHYMLESGAKVANVPAKGPEVDCEFPIGELCKAKVIGINDSTPDSVRAALSTGEATGGGITIPRTYAAGVLDLARARSVLMNAGVQTIVMTTDKHRIARLTSDPTMSEKIENDTFAESTLTVGAVDISPRMIGCLVKASREVVEDSPNIAQLIEQAMASAMAIELDNLGLNGEGGRSILGLLNYDELPETTSVGALTHTGLADGAKSVRLNNYEPSAAIMSVSAKHQLDLSKDSEGRWLGPPPNLTFPLLDTTNMADSQIVVGDFSLFAWAIRQDVQVEVSREAGDSFEKHQVYFKIYFRGDTALLRAGAFRLLSGVTLS